MGDISRAALGTTPGVREQAEDSTLDGDRVWLRRGLSVELGRWLIACELAAWWADRCGADNDSDSVRRLAREILCPPSVLAALLEEHDGDAEEIVRALLMPLEVVVTMLAETTHRRVRRSEPAHRAVVR